ncbi:MAG: hypothetical protein CMJ29_07235 [Phycisphaerae bacterium]|nr:hypothetical protein [Phycisphaerae bacterium]
MSGIQIRRFRTRRGVRFDDDFPGLILGKQPLEEIFISVQQPPHSRAPVDLITTAFEGFRSVRASCGRCGRLVRTNG